MCNATRILWTVRAHSARINCDRLFPTDIRAHCQVRICSQIPAYARRVHAKYSQTMGNVALPVVWQIISTELDIIITISRWILCGIFDYHLH